MAQTNDPTPGPTAGAKIISMPDAQVPLNLQFSDESGQAVKLGDYFQPNRPVLLIMVYFGCPQLCSLSLNGLTEAVRKIDLQPGKQFEIVTVSFNPKEGPQWPRPRRRITSSRWASPRPPPAGTSSPAATRPPPRRWATPSVSASG